MALLAIVVFVIIPYLFWKGTWFGTQLSDPEISEYLGESDKPRKIQHALEQIDQKLRRGDTTVRQWYPQLTGLSDHPVKEVRLTLAWLMGEDAAFEGFHESLLRLVRDPEPMVRRNAALSLVRFNDRTGKGEILSILKPLELASDRSGPLALFVMEGVECRHGQALARIGQSDSDLLRAPITGSVQRIHASAGETVQKGQVVFTILSDETQQWEALRALYLIGDPSDLEAVTPLTGPEYPETLRQQAQNTLDRIKGTSR